MNDNTSPWNHIQKDLESALSTWEDLALSSKNKLTPDQEQLNQIKQILKEITSQMETFSNDTPAKPEALSTEPAPTR